MTFSDLSPYYTDDKMDIKRRMEQSYREGITLNQQYWNEADIDTRFHAGDQTLWNQIYGQLIPITRRQFTFNRIRRIVNMPVGFQRRNRKTSIVTPVHNADQQGADDNSGVLQWVNNNNNFYNSLSDSFEGALITGLNLLSFWVDYRQDPVNGEIKVDNLPYNAAFIDPTSKKKDLTDANYIWTRKWMSKKQITSLMPERSDEINAMPYTANRDDKFIFLPENYQYGIRGLLPYDEYWYLDYRTQKNIYDQETGEMMEWEGAEKDLKQYLEMYPQLTMIKTEKQTYKLAVSVGNRVVYDGPNPYGIDQHPFIATWGYFSPYIPYYALKQQGIVRGLRDAQYIYNRKVNILNDIMESQINSGIKYKENALVDPNDAFLTGQGRALALKANADMNDVQTIPPPDLPPSIFELSKVMADEISQISGVNEELLGSAQDEKAGVLSMLRQGAGLTTLQILFDQLDDTQMQAGRLTLELIHKNFTPQHVAKILGHPASPEFENKLFPKYNCNVEEGVMTLSQKQMQFQQLVQLRELGINVPEGVLVQAAQLQDKKQLTDAVEAQAQQAQQQEQAQQQQAMQAQQVTIDSIQAKSESDRAVAQERINKISLDAAVSAERIERSQEERDNATLAKVKTLKELEDMDLSHLERLIEMLHRIEEHTQMSKVNAATPIELLVPPNPNQAPVGQMQQPV